MKTIRSILPVLIIISLAFTSTKLILNGEKISIPTSGNSWLINNPIRSNQVINEFGISNWTEQSDVIRTFFYAQEPIKVNISLNIKEVIGNSVIQVKFGSRSKNIVVANITDKEILCGDWNIKKPGYYFIDLQGISKTGNKFAVIPLINLHCNKPKAIKHINEDFHFGRRGPSVHLAYKNPEGTKDIEWFYNEIEIPKGQDIIGSYFMANGFNEGYFGIQVNSASERRILFSVWSPFATDNPLSIPDDQKIILLKKGNEVTTGEFGNEGSGGQSYRKYNWKTEIRYKFLVRAQPSNDSSTVFTGYFFNNELNKWELIASFKRPKTKTYLTGLYSFLENFYPETGIISRKGTYYNHWVKGTNGDWKEITEANFSADATAKAGRRFDYSGGATENGFYLKNCGFTNENTIVNSILMHNTNPRPPQLDLIHFD